MMGPGNLNYVLQALKHSRDPIARSKQLLIEEYLRTDGIRECRVPVMAEYELLKSICVQAAYEIMGDGRNTTWLEAGILDQELNDAKVESLHQQGNGMEQLLRKADPNYLNDDKNIRRIKNDNEASDYRRFIGSVREYVPGVGYAISVRKREGTNQDSFLISSGVPTIFAVADGCSGSRFSSIASNKVVKEVERRRESLFTTPKRVIAGINDDIADLLSDELMTKLLATWNGGSTTLTLSISDENRVRFYKVGDSLPFMCTENCVSRSVECVSNHSLLLNVIGQAIVFEDSYIEDFERKPGQTILTTDGVTNYAEDFMRKIHSIVNITSDAVMIAESIIRSVLRGQINLGSADDATIIVQEISG